jgi:putative component of membrane protein insertase Oxa1/YidC/SpoIIIJ protein YidD
LMRTMPNVQVHGTLFCIAFLLVLCSTFLSRLLTIACTHHPTCRQFAHS